MKKLILLPLLVITLSVVAQIKNYKQLYPMGGSYSEDGSGYTNYWDKDSLEIYKRVSLQKDSSSYEDFKEHPYSIRAFSIIDKNNNLKYYPADSLYVDRTMMWRYSKVTKTVVKGNKVLFTTKPYWKKTIGSSTNNVDLNSTFYFGKAKKPIKVIQLFKDK